MSDNTNRRRVQGAPSLSPGLGENAVRDISGALNVVLADVFTLFVKTKTFHWHVSGPHFRDYHLLLDEQSGRIFAMMDVVAERVRERALDINLGHQLSLLLAG
jgi:starvation-inducible DNA-binding protein